MTYRRRGGDEGGGAPRAFAADYDGTLAEDGRVRDSTWRSLDLLKAEGWRLVLVTGRELSDLRAVCPRLDRFDLAVLENGALLYDPVKGVEVLIGPSPPPELVARLRLEGVDPISVGRGIVALWEPHLEVARRAVAEIAEGWTIVRNKRAVMLLPVGVDKASGLTEALARLGVEPAETVAVGDAENDLPMLTACGFSAAVANALPAVREAVDYRCRGARGEGVEELIDLCLSERLPSRRRL